MEKKTFKEWLQELVEIAVKKELWFNLEAEDMYKQFYDEDFSPSQFLLETNAYDNY